MKRDAAVADAVLMAAFEAGPGVAEQDRARRQHGRALRGAVAERALGDDGDADVVVPLLERPVVGSGPADDIADAPAFAGKQIADGNVHGRQIAISPKNRNPSRV